MRTFLFFLLLLLNSGIHAEQMVTSDTIIARKQQAVENMEKNAEKKSINQEKAPESNFTSSWKFYFILLAFPVILIIIFVLVFIRGKRG